MHAHPADAAHTDDLDAHRDLVDRLFCKPNAPYGPYERAGEPEVIVPGLLFRVELNYPGDLAGRLEASVFIGIQGFAGELWEHEVRGLLRLDALSHPALPTIRSGGFDAANEVAFAITESQGQALNVDATVRWAQSARIEAFEAFSVLLDALNHLHGARLMHRNLTLGALRAVQRHGEDAVTVQLSRFELSTLIGNLVRRTALQNSAQVGELVRRLYLAAPQGMDQARHLAYLAPETLDFLLHERSGRRREWATTDVFGLGVLGFEWFCGPIPELLPEEFARAQAAAGPAQAIALATLRARMRAHLTGRVDLPKPLVSLLREMLEEAPEERITSFQALRRLEQNWEGIRRLWEDAADEVPRLVAFLPDQSVETIFELRKWISHSPDTPAGREALRNFYVRELRGAELVWSPNGAVGFANDEPEKLQEARWVLIGEQAVWFCAFLYDQDLLTRQRGEQHEDTLVIKYLKDRNHAQALVRAQPRRKVGRIEVVPFYPGQSLAKVRAGRPSWRPLTESVKRARARSSEEQEFLRSLDFLLAYQRTALDARKYPFIRTDKAEDPGLAVLTWDEHRDAAWRHRSQLLTAFSTDPKRRPRLSDFVENLDVDSDFITLDVVPGHQRGPYFGHRVIKVDLVERRDRDTIVVRPHRNQDRVPSIGWLRPSDDGGSEPQIARQAKARTMLENQAALIRSLRAPISYDLGRGRWRSAPDAQLEGEAPDRINDMLALQPFYALQGPPGTGKSTVAAHALRRFLREEPGARVLVSAQSNYALDNLAARLIKEMPDVLILRETPDGQDDEERVKDHTVLAHTLGRLTDRLAKTIESQLTWMLHPERLSPEERRRFEELPPGERPLPLNDQDRPVADAWLQSVTSNQIELTDRIKNGASIVLATCSIAATITDTDRDPGDMFDWVIVEEAAKAWPTELIIPLVLGTRWTLIGDHRQLGAHREEEVLQFLRSLRDHPDKDMRLHYDEREMRERVLRMFGHLFVDREEPDTGPVSYHASPLGQLNLQFRMHPDIAQPVGRAFYPYVPFRPDDDGLPKSFLGTSSLADLDHGVQRPGFLRGAALVWLDTTGLEDCAEHPYWYNQGEVEVIDRLVDRMRPAPLAVDRPAEDDGGLVVLTPYRAQKNLLENKGLLRGRVHTVHSFQGREADRVIVSLVRTTRSGNTVAGNVGHVGRNEVANVLLSRGRRLLVLVGGFAHFAEHGGTSWDIITKTVRRYGRIVPAEQLTGE
ncbi:AAA domain-containing protein [Streptomyces rubellomurinus]|uniref:Protein kinase domain-containing protein n=1 Tax=Streptomyces rubellomurinus (strain ATCC 31215) TaxID=359131 RepID=A0A0F2TIG4_STRR3|nr:AAA domain-containing protein [Streptomyces rubellomurinus]KJS61497.1 hypothetical protein VM95_14410 [Streptomyces rubellomurinus]